MGVFVAQATNTPLGIGGQLLLLGVLLLTSKGSAGVAGAASSRSPRHCPAMIPIAGLVLPARCGRFMNEARAVVNLIGNGVATIAIAKWEGALDRDTGSFIAEQRGGRAPPDRRWLTRRPVLT
ncbi:MAG: dctA [Rhizobium sp.]|nr:dctA [Rhizobium sp.]